MSPSIRNLTMLLSSVAAAAGTCGGGVSLHPSYAPDHENYLCMNYTRPTPLPCRAASDGWEPAWLGKQPKFMIYSWWPPVPADFEAYADAGFNLALTGNAVSAYCYRVNQEEGAGYPVTHDELFDAIVAASDELSKLGVLAVWMTDNLCNPNLGVSPTTAYGNATGGIIPGHVNLTSKAPGSPIGIHAWTDGAMRSKGLTVPEIEYIVSELKRRGKIDQFGGMQVHDDTETQTGATIAIAQYLKQHHPAFIPIVNQVSGNSGPQTLYRSELYISSPEQYSIQCPPTGCADINATAAAAGQMRGYWSNAQVDSRFGLASWPLFHIGAAHARINGTSVNYSNPDYGTPNVRSDSLVRFQAYAAIAFGAQALNYYCWGHGVYWVDDNMTQAGRPSPIYQTVREVNADASLWGDTLLQGGFRFANDLHTGWTSFRGATSPGPATVVSSMSDLLLVGVFTSATQPSVAYLFVVDKRVSGELEPLAARNVSLVLHPAVGGASVLPPGQQGRTGFDHLRTRHGLPPNTRDASRRHYAHVRKGAHAGGATAGAGARGGALSVTVELVGGGGSLVRLEAAAGRAADLLAACHGFGDWSYEPGQASLRDGVGVKAPAWAYDSWHAAYRPYEDLELTAGLNFEDGEQTGLILGASLLGAAPPAEPDESRRWAMAGFNILSMAAPSAEAIEAYDADARAVGAVLDNGYTYGFFGVVEPGAGSSALSSADVVRVNGAYRCHGRWAGLLLARNVSGVAMRDAAAHAALTLRTSYRGNWLLPFASVVSGEEALTLGASGLPLSMPLAPSPDGFDEPVAWARAVAAQYEVMRGYLAAHYEPTGSAPGQIAWRSTASMPFVAAIDVCSSESDSMLRWAAFSALAYGARGVFWQGAGVCAPLGSPRFGLLSSITTRIAAWGNTFLADAPTGYNATHMWATGYAIPHAVAPGGEGALVQAADDDVMVVELGAMGRWASRLIYVVDKRVESTPGAAPLRTLRVTLRSDVTATQPLEGDCVATRCQCGMSLLGNTLTLKLPGGSGQLVALFIKGELPA